MRRPLLTLVLLCLIVSVSDAQIWHKKRYEAILGFGPSMFFGDVGGFSQGKNLLGFKDITLNQIRYNINASARYRITQEFDVRLSLTAAALHASDRRGSNEGRSLEASMLIMEPALIGEYFFVKNKAENSWLFSKGKNTSFIDFVKSLDFYVFTGIGGVNYSLKGNEYLQLHGYNSGGFAAVVPVGIGSTLIYSPNFNFGIELAGRYAFTDNLDGYTSQYSKANDVYYFLNFTVIYKVKTGPKGLPSFR
jgi:hypothetical protein